MCICTPSAVVQHHNMKTKVQTIIVNHSLSENESKMKVKDFYVSKCALQMLKERKEEPIIEKDVTHKGTRKQGQQQASSLFIVIAVILCLMGFKSEKGD